MEEIELKILEIDRKPIEEKLISLGATKVFDDVVHTVFYDDIHDSIKSEKNLLRLRSLGNKNYLTYKKYVQDNLVKIRKEFEIEFSDFKTMDHILQELGFHVELSTKKHRTSYNYQGTSFEFDRYLEDYKFIPELLEIEADSPTTIQQYLSIFDLKKNMVRPWSFFKVAQYYKEKNKK